MISVTFWLAADVETKYLLNVFLYQGKDETRPAGEHLSETGFETRGALHVQRQKCDQGQLIHIKFLG